MTPDQQQPPSEMARAIQEVTDRASLIFREEIELAKAEISDKLNRLLAGSVVGVVAGVFLLAALILVMHGIAIVLGENAFDGRVWLGYLVEAVVFLLIAAGAGFYAYRSIRKATPPVPEMAIEQAKFRAPVEPGCLLELHVGFIQKRARVCKFWGKASVEGKLTCEVQFTAMIADAPGAS